MLVFAASRAGAKGAIGAAVAMRTGRSTSLPATRCAKRSAFAGPAAAEYRSRYIGSRDPEAPVASEAECNAGRALAVLPYHSLKLTRCGMRCLAAPGQVCYFPSAAKQRIPPRSA